MSITPLDIKKMSFPRKMRGVDPEEVENFLELVAEELSGRLGDLARFEQENRLLRVRLEEANRRQKELQESLLHAQKLSKDITDNARREAELVLREAQVAADDMVNQAIERANQIDGKIVELRTARRDMQLKFRNSLELFSRILEADVDDERSLAMIHTLPRRKTSP